MQTIRATYRVSGTIRGGLWWPTGELGYKTFEYRTDERPATARELCDSIMTREDGDFQGNIRLCGDTVLTITHHGTTGRHSRSWYLSDLPSLSDYTTSDLPSYEWEEEA